MNDVSLCSDKQDRKPDIVPNHPDQRSNQGPLAIAAPIDEPRDIDTRAKTLLQDLEEITNTAQVFSVMADDKNFHSTNPTEKVAGQQDADENQQRTSY